MATAEELEANKKRLEEAKKYFRDNLIAGIEKKVSLGGQHCGIPVHPFVVKSEDLGVEIRVEHFRSNYQNKDFAMLLMDLVIDELIR
jgi:hypothetical protein